MDYPKIELTSDAQQQSDGIAIGLFHQKAQSKEKRPSLVYRGTPHKDIKHLLEMLGHSNHFSAKKNEVNMLRFYSLANFPNVFLLGLGLEETWSAELSRQIGAALYLAQRKEWITSVTLWTEGLFSKIKPDDLAYFVQAFCEGYWLAGYRFQDLRKEKADEFSPKCLFLHHTHWSKQCTEAVKKALILAKAVNFARNLGDRPGNYMTPSEFASSVEKMGKERHLKVQILRRKDIEKERMGLVLGVANGSSEEPTFVILEHKGSNKSARPIALVGKGVTFDSGGISLKPAARMEDMKYDMMGAAAVVGIFQAVSELNLPVNLQGFIAATENMPGGRAQKPGDVAKSISGKTVEIINTDAEGRLILADALEYAQKNNPQAIFDFATLTGAVVDALGTTACGIMGNHPELISRLKASSLRTAERVWELPLFEEFEDDLKSNVADIKNTGVREAGSSKGGTFLKFFVDKKFPWAHCDMAGAAYHRKDVNYHPSKYGSGVMIRLMVDLLESWKPLK